jgi:hypothetical protein
MSAFDKIAKKAEEKTKKSSIPTVAVPKNIAKNIDEFVAVKATIASSKTELLTLETGIIAHLQELQDKMAFEGDFEGSLRAQGLKEEAITYVTSDRFTAPQDEASLAELKRLLGKTYDDLFEIKRVTTMKKEALENEALLNKIASLCEKSGMLLNEAFEVGDKVVAKKGLNEKQYLSIPKDKLPIFRTLVRQYKASLK